MKGKIPLLVGYKGKDSSACGIWEGKIPLLVGYGKERFRCIWDIKGKIPQLVGYKGKDSSARRI